MAVRPGLEILNKLEKVFDYLVHLRQIKAFYASKHGKNLYKLCL